MLKSKFLDIVRTFTPDEFRGFRLFVRSPFHNSNKNVIKVTEIVRNFYPSLSDQRLEKENIFKKIYPGKKYNDTVMRIILSDMLQLAEEYLIYINVSKNSIEAKKFLLNELDKRKLDVLFNRHLKEVRTELSAEGLIDTFYFLNLYEIETKNIDNLISRGKQTESASEVLRQGEYLINFFLIGILNIAHELRTQEEVLNVKFDFNIVNEILKTIDIKKFLEVLRQCDYKFFAVLSIYYYMYLSYSSPENEDNFLKLKELILNNINKFTREEKFNLFIILENTCTSQAISGQKNYFENLMEIYELMITNKIYTHSEAEHFQLNLFRNMFYTAISLKKFDWAEKFIDEHLDKLLPQYRDDIKHLAYAFIYFGKRDLNEALSEITQVRYNFFVFKFDVRVLTLKIYFEMSSFEEALSLIDSFTHFITNNKSSEAYKESFLNFLKFTKQLIKLRTGNNKKDAREIEGRILEETRLVNKSWLLEKTSEI